jgi:hypothetical protein|tara:strand:- start:4499 stop:5092 length:594 start_codon:yes stop_codon:yes gene_type:complete
MINEQIYRRFNHTVAACFVIYFLFPEYILEIKREYYILLFWILIITVEYLRLNNHLEVIGMRDYENDRIAGFVWFATGTCLILGFYELGFWPQSLAIATIIMAAYTDPLIGEVNQRFGDRWGVGLGLLCSFLIYQLILGVIFYSIIGSIIAVASERPKIKWFDDDLAMQLIPIIVLTILSLMDFSPELPQEILGGNL